MGFVDNQTFTIKKIDKDSSHIVIQYTDNIELSIPVDDIQRMFYAAYCITVQKPPQPFWLKRATTA